MTAIQIADSFDSFAIDHTPDGWPAVQQKQLTEAAAELRRLEAQLQKETAARQAAQIEAEALKERLVRADAEKCAAVLAERIAPNAPVQEPVHKLIYPGGGKALFNRLWHLTCNAVATQSGMRVRTDVMPMREMKEFLDHLCVLVDSPPQPVPAPVQEQQPAPASKPVLLQCLGCERVGTQEQLSASTDCDCWLHTQPAPAERTAQEPETDVRKIMLAVVPGFDGMGAEVYAKSTKDVEDKLSALGSELEEWQLGIRRLLAPVQEPDPCPGCRPNTVCRTPSCGRLKLRAAQPRKESN